ncbi:glutamine amidotransferase [Peribacillus huizhouensis]|uniref:Membrane protein n=1 Tax=Peribacillus huizhouensis TaxID=1501239 RepID=A0ABR6CMV1_9BACI|nr:glutamine amidotransferase [Peribacillus huizhouensis]MBA9026357.1 putative membrane protein [Peribacillus huizhouensis]
MRILFIGESWTVHMIHAKGYDTFESTKYEEGATFLIDSLRNRGIEIDYMPSHEVQVRFPDKLEALEQYDSIVISDIGSNTFLLQNKTFYYMERIPNSLELIRQYVENGGGLLMIGGYLSFMGIEGKANYKNTILADVLPVEMLDRDDRVEKPEGVYPETTLEHSITKGLEQWPPFLGYNRFSAKENATTLVQIEGDPLLVIGEYGKGKTAAFASDCAPHWGPIEFMDWEYYQPLWQRILEHIKK